MIATHRGVITRNWRRSCLSKLPQTTHSMSCGSSNDSCKVACMDEDFSLPRPVPSSQNSIFSMLLRWRRLSEVSKNNPVPNAGKPEQKSFRSKKRSESQLNVSQPGRGMESDFLHRNASHEAGNAIWPKRGTETTISGCPTPRWCTILRKEVSICTSWQKAPLLAYSEEHLGEGCWWRSGDYLLAGQEHLRAVREERFTLSHS